MVRCCCNNIFRGEFCKSANRWRWRTFCRIVSSGFWNKVFFFSRFIRIHFIYSSTWKLPKAFSRSFSISGPAGFSFWLQIPFRCNKSYTRSSQFSKAQHGSCSGSLPQCYCISSAAGTTIYSLNLKDFTSFKILAWLVSFIPKRQFYFIHILQIVGPISFRVDSGIAVDLKNLEFPIQAHEPVFAVEYALHVLGSAKAVAWCCPKRQEFMVELRFYET